MRIDIRNMVCRHCVKAVESIFNNMGINTLDVGIGYAITEHKLNDEQFELLDTQLNKAGFSRLIDQNDIIVENIKHAVMHHVRDEHECKYNLSACVENRVGMTFSTLSRIFSLKEGRTVEKYHIALKVERVKELLDDYANLTLADIAFKTGYSSVAHLSSQFKSETGLTPSQYKALKPGRQAINEL